MKNKIKNNILKRSLSIFICLSLFVTPILPVLALAPVNVVEIANKLKDGSSNADFTINLSNEEQIKLAFSDSSLEKIIKEYLEEKVADHNVLVDVNLVDKLGHYTLKTEEDSYTGTFNYSDEKVLTVSNLEDVKTLIKEQFGVEQDVIITNKGMDSYEVTALEKVVDFNITVIQVSSNNETPILNNSEGAKDLLISPAPASDPSVTYQTHIENVSWQPLVSNGELSGTIGRGLRLEAIKISLQNNSLSGNIEYQTHIQNIGWQSAKTNGDLSGTSGQGLRLEAIKMNLTGDIASEYDVYYQVHAENFGWLNWAKNGENAGTTGYGYRLEAIRIKLVKKTDTSITTGNSYVERPPYIRSQAQVQNIGWDQVGYKETIGTTGRGLKLEALKLALDSVSISGGISYQTHVENIGWQSVQSDGGISGTVGQGLRIEALKMNLTGNIANSYDIYYRVHAENVGWLGWAKNGENAGTTGYGYRVEALQVVLVSKGGPAPGATTNTFIQKPMEVYYQAHVSGLNWQKAATTNEIVGTMGQGRAIEALKIQINNNSNYPGTVNYQAHVGGIGWQPTVSTGEIAGTTGQGRSIEALKISLTGDLAASYDIYYRTYIENYGWMDWAKNGEDAGSIGLGLRVESLQINLIKKGDPTPSNTTRPCLVGKWVVENGYTYYYDQFGTMANDFKVIDGTKYFFNSLGALIGSNVRRVIDVSSHNGTIDWNAVKASGTVDGVILRVAAGSVNEDTQLARNVSELNRLNIPYGIYIYSYAEDQLGLVTSLSPNYEKEATLEAKRVLNAISKYNMHLSFPIYYDLEANVSTSNFNPTIYRQIVTDFGNTINAAGYDYRIYTYTAWAETALNSDFLRSKIAWIAQYNHFSTYTGSYDAWQYTSSDTVAGITGNVDSNVWFR